jgi:ubiquitin carboxyl-terminal hydrolase L3
VNVERLKKNEDKELGSEDNNGKVNYYMKQSGTLDNACGIIACLHAALNNLDKITLNADSILHKFHESMKDKTPAERCTGLENDQAFK